MQENEISKLVKIPSLGAVSYQAHRLTREIGNLNLSDQPEIGQVRNLLLCLSDQVEKRLWQLFDPSDPLYADEQLTRSLGRSLRNIHSFVRYICIDQFRKHHAALQFIFNELAKAYVPCDTGTPICIVRTKWHYATECEPLSERIQAMLHFSDFADQEAENDSPLDPSEVLRNWWTAWVDKLSVQDRDRLKPTADPPLQIAVLSFPGLDSDDALLYPLLAHELGHFIDSSEHESLSKQIETAWPDDETDVAYTIALSRQSGFRDLYSGEPLTLPQICIRELLADILAVRLIGFGYFISLAEYLKTMYPWQHPIVDVDTGYPGVALRLRIILEHVISEDGLNLSEFISSSQTSAPAMCNFVQSYVKVSMDWLNECLPAELNEPIEYESEDGDELPEDTLTRCMLKVVNDSIKHITAAAAAAVREPCVLTPGVFDRIEALRNDKIPCFEGDTASSFGEIMASIWMYEFTEGEPREILAPAGKEQYDLYNSTCQKVIRSMEQIYQNARSHR